MPHKKSKPIRTNDPFSSWKHGAEWFEEIMEDFHESDRATVSDQQALLRLFRDLELLQQRLNASANQDVRTKRTR